MTTTAPTIEKLTATRHLVYRDLLSLLPPSSIGQALQFIENLALCRNQFRPDGPGRDRNRVVSLVMKRLLNLRVSPDIATASPYIKPSRGEIETALSEKYGERLLNIAGFFEGTRTKDARPFRLNLPERCALYGYRSRTGFYAGIVCQPLDSIDKFFLLSSRGQGGQSAQRLEWKEREFLERFNQPPATPAVLPSADLAGYRWTGRRFVETESRK